MRAIRWLRSGSVGKAGRGPSPRPRHRLPQQLVLPGGLLRRGDAGGDHNTAAPSHERSGEGVRGRRPPSARCRGSGAECGGFEGGRSISSPVPMYAHWVGWLTGRSGLGDGTKLTVGKLCDVPAVTQK